MSIIIRYDRGGVSTLTPENWDHRSLEWEQHSLIRESGAGLCYVWGIWNQMRLSEYIFMESSLVDFS